MTQTASALVVDASVAVKWHLRDEEHTEAADLLLTRFSEGSLTLVAPDYVQYEVPSAIVVATLGTAPRISQEDGRDAITEFLSLGLTTLASTELILASYLLVHQLGVAFYDGLYLALAQRLGIQLITADRRLYQKVNYLPDVVWLGDYPPQSD